MNRLRCYMNWLALEGMDAATIGSSVSEHIAAIQAAGYDGIQFIDPIDHTALTEARTLNLGVCGSHRINTPAEAAPIAQSAADAGLECLTLHVGWGLESDDEGARLIEAVLTASTRHRIPLYVETHRATLFQDMQRTVQFIARFPDLRFNADFSHWYTGSEMVYGGFETKLAYIQPVIDRVRFLHGRIGNPGCMQVAITPRDIEAPAPYIAHFRTLWTRCFAAYLRAAASPDSAVTPSQPFITFTPELLAPGIYYSRTFPTPSGPQEESDRWQQSLLLTQIARECFAAANSPNSAK
jgi:hypothetical protein